MPIRCALLAQPVSVDQQFLSTAKTSFVRFLTVFLQFASHTLESMACSLLTIDFQTELLNT
jgi:hypothetical protein